MATTQAVRRGGSLLLRALAVSGFAAAAWLVCTGAAAADEDHSDEAVTPPDAVTVVFGPESADFRHLPADARRTTLDRLAPQRIEPARVVPPVATVAPEPVLPAFEPAALDAAALDASAFDASAFDVATFAAVAFESSGFDAATLPVVTSSAPVAAPAAEEDGFGYSGGSANGYSRSGEASNTMPAPLYEAKVAAKAAALEAAEQAVAAAAEPSAEVVSGPVRADVRPAAPTTEPVQATTQVTPDAEVTWEAPAPSAPAPAPKQVPTPSAPTASSGSADSGSGHRGGNNVVASLADQANLLPSAAWSAERRDDGRSPGSVPGLPSTSPD
ncbi:hypothetical protein ACIGNX_07360 [Actinosynnema sp. NPDC053489]|uniref:hypothetical protein n=1 Tax=Actinosynnema sp. NPDC053489 TaxID=3363916 RepID=UPI0037CC0AE4